jgi:hypothetical protein
MMADIYSHARSVIIWLGFGCSDTVDCMRLIGAIHRYGEAVATWRYVIDFLANARLGKPRDIVRPSFRRVEQGTHQLTDNHQYWTRVWTVQEVALNRKCWVYHGYSKPVSPDAFARSVNLIDYYLGFLDVRSLDNTIASRAWSHKYNNIIELHCLSHHREQHLDRNTFFQALIEKKATDPRDLIFGLRAIYPNILSKIDVDYSSTVERVFTEAAIAILESSKKLYPLVHYACLGPKTFNVPSWVPDWTCFAESRIDEYPNWVLGDLQEPIWIFDETCNSISLKGMFLGTVIHPISEVFPLADEGNLDEWYDGAREMLQSWINQCPRKNLADKHNPASFVNALVQSWTSNVESVIDSFITWLNAPRGWVAPEVGPGEPRTWDTDSNGSLVNFLESALKHLKDDLAGQRIFCFGRDYFGAGDVSPGDVIVWFAGSCQVEPTAIRKVDDDQHRSFRWVSPVKVFGEPLLSITRSATAAELDDFVIV